MSKTLAEAEASNCPAVVDVEAKEGTIPLIEVDNDGFDGGGADYGYVATPEAIADGLAVTQAIVLRYPDGSMCLSTRTLVTQKGLERLKSMLVGGRLPEGTA